MAKFSNVPLFFPGLCESNLETSMGWSGNGRIVSSSSTKVRQEGIAKRIGGHMGSHSPSRPLGGSASSWSGKSNRHPNRKSVIEKRIKTEVTLLILGFFGENTFPLTPPQTKIPSLHSTRSLSTSRSNRAHVCRR